jgi:hypothetical protein
VRHLNLSVLTMAIGYLRMFLCGPPTKQVNGPHARMKAHDATPARTSPLFHYDLSGWSRSGTTAWKAKDPVPQRNSTAGAPTATHARAPMRNSNNRSPSAFATSSLASVREMSEDLREAEPWTATGVLTTICKTRRYYYRSCAACNSALRRAPWGATLVVAGHRLSSYDCAAVGQPRR